MSAVVVVGAGPTGLMLAAELALAGVEVTVLEQRPSPDLAGTRARGFHARTMELFDQRGIADRFLDRGQTVPMMSFAGVLLPVADLATRHPYTLALGQAGIEEVLEDWVAELGVPIHRGCQVVGLSQDTAGVDVDLAGGERIRCSYLVGADGGRSVVRRSTGIDFVGPDPTRSYLIAEIAVADEVEAGMRMDEVGVHALSVMEDGPQEEGQRVSLVLTEPDLVTDQAATLADLRAGLRATYGTDFGAHNPTWISRFTDAARQAVTYRSGRVLLAGDAAHVHPPTGGQGLGLGIGDAVNLGWKVARVARGIAGEELLDTYAAERHPLTARVLANVVTQARLQRGDLRTSAMQQTFAEVLASDQARAQMAAFLTGLDVQYDVGSAHPLAGRRMPDLDITCAGQRGRVFELLHQARPLMINCAGAGRIGAADLTDIPSDSPSDISAEVVTVEVTGPSNWEIPGLGSIAVPAAVLVRPDGHIAWVDDGDQTGRQQALAAW